MNKFFYILSMTLSWRQSNKSLYVITLFSFMCSFLLSTFVLVLGYSVMHHVYTASKLNSTGLIELSGRFSPDHSFSQIPFSALDKLVNQFRQIEYMNMVASTTELVLYGGNSYDLIGDVSYVSDDLDKMYPDFIVRGSWFSEEGNQDNGECVIGARVAHQYFGNRSPINQSIQILSKTYTIIGITDSSTYTNRILIPVSNYRHQGIQDRIVYYIKWSDSSQDYTALQQEINRNFGTYVFKELSTEVDDQQRQINKSIASIFTISCVVLLFSSLNTIGLLTNRINDQRTAIAVKFAHGARAMDLYVQLLFELTILAALAVLIVYAAIWLISEMSVNLLTFPLIVNLDILWMLMTMAIVIAGSISGILLRRILRLPINEILGGRA